MPRPVTALAQPDCPWLYLGFCAGPLDLTCGCHPQRTDPVPAAAVSVRYCAGLYCPACRSERTLRVERHGDQYFAPGGIPRCRDCSGPMKFRRLP